MLVVLWLREFLNYFTISLDFSMKIEYEYLYTVLISFFSVSEGTTLLANMYMFWIALKGMGIKNYHNNIESCHDEYCEERGSYLLLISFNIQRKQFRKSKASEHARRINALQKV